MGRLRLLVLLLGMLILSPGLISAQSRIEKNIVVGTYSGLALLMDVHYPENPNGYGIIHIEVLGEVTSPYWSGRPSSANPLCARILPNGYTK